MIEFLRSNGWETLWSEDYWIKTAWLNDPTKNVDTCGYSTEEAYERCKKELEEKVAGCEPARTF